MSTATRRRAVVHVEGTVQGVGFRPHVFRLAQELALAGWVLNDSHGVLVEVEGSAPAVVAFLERLALEAPPLARVERVVAQEVAPRGETGFAVVQSAADGEPSALVCADSATCADCLRELFDPADRRYRYPFINCTSCGPRFTIVTAVPYDRQRTTMAGFSMCRACRAENNDPRNRRFHAQPNACPACGPSVRLVGTAGHDRGDPVAAAAAALRAGRIVAVKGIGGFHLACVADHEAAVAALRARKHREDKPFALMTRDLDAARALVDLAPEDEALLTGPQRPIVLAPRRKDAKVAAAVAPGCADLGVMLPYSPLHHLLLADAGGTLVMTSGNLRDEPIAYRDEDALERLAAIADLFLLHDRPIRMRTDDSVVRAVPRRAALMLRRSRGYVPASIDLPVATPRPLLACGAQLKSTFCVAKGPRAWVGHHIGDLGTWETLRSLREGIAHFERIFAVSPEVIAHDLHPDYASTAYALEREGAQRVAVQHHHAHLAACLAEHGADGRAVGAIFDGTGHGADGTAWGGEFLVGDLTQFERAGHLRPVRLPGGDHAAREPWRMACAWLVEALDDPQPAVPPRLRSAVNGDRWRAVAKLASTGLAAPMTTSAGRLFDAVAALCGLRTTVTYEGQAAIELEAAVRVEERGAYPFDVYRDAGSGAIVVDPREAIRLVARGAASGCDTGVIAARFHNGLARATAAACTIAAAGYGVEMVVLSGGVFQNRVLLSQTATALEEAGLRVLIPERLPANDGGVSYGQAAVAAARLAAGGP